MPLLSDATALYVGGQAATRAYLGATEVWTPPASGSDPTIVGTTQASGFSSTTTIGVPTEHVDGDRLVLVIGANDWENITGGLGAWTQRVDLSIANNGAVHQYVYEKAASSEPASYSVTWDGTHNHHAVMLAIRDAGAIEVVGSTATASGTSLVIPSITVATAGSLVLGAICNDLGGTYSVSGMTIARSGNTNRAHAAYVESVAAGTAGSWTVTTTTSANIGGVALALPPV